MTQIRHFINFVNLLKQITNAISKVDAVSITTNSATTINGTSLQAVTVHYISDDWKQVSFCAALVEMEGMFDSLNLIVLWIENDLQSPTLPPT